MKLLYFAWIRERIGAGAEDVTFPPEVSTIGQVIDFLTQRGENYAYAFEDPAIIRTALDAHHASHEASILNVREIAFFPPMTGG